MYLEDQASTCTLHVHTNKPVGMLLEFPGQGMQHSDSAVLHSGTGRGPDSSDEQRLQNCRANCSTVCFKALLKTTARLQAWEVKDGNIQKNHRRDRKTESSFFFFVMVSQKPIRKTSRRGRPARKKLSLLGPRRSLELMAAWCQVPSRKRETKKIK